MHEVLRQHFESKSTVPFAGQPKTVFSDQWSTIAFSDLEKILPSADTEGTSLHKQTTPPGSKRKRNRFVRKSLALGTAIGAVVSMVACGGSPATHKESVLDLQDSGTLVSNNNGPIPVEIDNAT